MPLVLDKSFKNVLFCLLVFTKVMSESSLYLPDRAFTTSNRR